MHQLASSTSIQERIGEYGCPPSPHLSPPFHRAFHPLDIAATWPMPTRAFERPLGLLPPPRYAALPPAEAAHLFSNALPFGH
jgi:hypothetical protein